MSTDFSIKPVGVPVATPVTQPVGGTSDDAVATELPASQSVTVAASATAARNDSPSTNDMLSHQVFVDPDAASIVYQVVDNRTSLVVRQFPDDAMLRRRAYFHALDMVKDDRARPLVTDRRA